MDVDKGAGGGDWKVSPPSFRPDVTREADLFEEVMRILGIEKLPSTIPKPPAPASPPPEPYALRGRLRSFMTGQGFCELVSYSFYNPNVLDKLELPADDPLRTRTAPILNPLSEESGALRTSLIPCLLSAARLNQHRGQFDLSLFELGAVFLSEKPGAAPLEKQSFAALLSGNADSALWCEEKRGPDFWDLKGVLEALAETFAESWAFSPDPALTPAFLDRREAGAVLRNNLLIGSFGLLKKSCAKNFGLKAHGGPVYLFELFPESLPPETVPAFQPYSAYPGVTRDLAVLADERTPAADLVRAIREAGDFPLKTVSVFDVYQGKSLPPGKKSLAFRLFFQDPGKTLSEELVGGWFGEILRNLEKECQAGLREQ
jgi:phenylalanyl-tRNA synthetase beta chain